MTNCKTKRNLIETSGNSFAEQSTDEFIDETLCYPGFSCAANGSLNKLIPTGSPMYSLNVL